MYEVLGSLNCLLELLGKCRRCGREDILLKVTTVLGSHKVAEPGRRYSSCGTVAEDATIHVLCDLRFQASRLRRDVVSENGPV